MKTTDKNSNKIDGIDAEIKLIRKKLDINASDWNKPEKEAIAKAYHSITAKSTGRGRALDTGCSSCVSGAVTIIKNYLAAIGEPVVVKTAKAVSKATATDNQDDDAKAGINDDEHLLVPENKNWRKNHESIAAAAKELEYTFKENEVSKADRVKALEAHITEINK